MLVSEDANSTVGLSLVMQRPALHRHVTSAMLFLVTPNNQSAIFFKGWYCNNCLISCYRTGSLDRKTLVQVLTGLLELLSLIADMTDGTTASGY